MEDYTISNSLEWSDMRTRLLKSKRNLAMFSGDINRLMNAIDKEIVKLGNLEINARNKKTPSSQVYVQEQLKVINQQIRNFNKFYMMALLTHD